MGSSLRPLHLMGNTQRAQEPHKKEFDTPRKLCSREMIAAQKRRRERCHKNSSRPLASRQASGRIAQGSVATAQRVKHSEAVHCKSLRRLHKIDLVRVLRSGGRRSRLYTLQLGKRYEPSFGEIEHIKHEEAVRSWCDPHIRSASVAHTASHEARSGPEAMALF